MKPWENKILITLFSITIAFFVCIMLWTNNIARENVGTDGFNTVVAPITEFFKKTGADWSGFFAHFQDTSKIINENEILKEENESLKKNKTELDNYKNENERLRALLGLKDNYHKYKNKTAQIISNNMTNWQSEFTINRGKNDGITVNSTVVSPRGLVGYVSSVGATWATVKTILNADVSVSGEIARTGAATITQGRLDLVHRLLCELTYVSKNAILISGDVVQTSGRGGIYPMGIIIGSIDDIKIDSQTTTQTAIITPAVNFSTLKEVVVIIK
ncbi:rod shape-determining protein MreC [Treponema sp. R6D11]